MKMKCNFDGIGYVNNLGRSKYWGVNRQKVGDREYGWRISLATGSKTESKHLYPTWEMSEDEAAHISASFYENPLQTVGVERSVVSRDGQFEYRINNQGQIKKFSIQFGSTIGSPTRFNVKGECAVEPNSKNTSKAVAGANGWSKQSIELLQNMIDISLNDTTADNSFFEMVKRIAEINLK